MYMVTSLSLEELGILIRERRVSLNNGKLLFGVSVDSINNYFAEQAGHTDYVIGLRGRLNHTTANLFKQMDDLVVSGNHVIIEAEIDETDVVRYRVDGVMNAAKALYYGMEDGIVCEELDDARLGEGDKSKVEVVCVPYINGTSHVRVTSLCNELSFNVEGITYVKLNGGV